LAKGWNSLLVYKLLAGRPGSGRLSRGDTDRGKKFLRLIGKSFLTVKLFHLVLLLGTGILDAIHITGLLKAE